MNKQLVTYKGKFRLQRGAAMMELGLALPLLAMFFFGFIELGRALYQDNQLTSAVVSGARFLAREPDAVTDTCAQGAAWSAAESTARNIIAYTQGGSGPVRLPGLDESGAITFNLRTDTVGGETACVIQADARTDFEGLFNVLVPFTDIAAIELNAQEEERYIGE